MSPADIVRELDAIGAAARSRMAGSTLTGLLPSGMDWMTADELSRAYELKRMLPSAAAEAEAARERIRARIAERRSRPGRGTAPKL